MLNVTIAENCYVASLASFINYKKRKGFHCSTHFLSINVSVVVMAGVLTGLTSDSCLPRDYGEYG